jgi:outer membrane receptor protein involved in Fe transport
LILCSLRTKSTQGCLSKMLFFLRTFIISILCGFSILSVSAQQRHTLTGKIVELVSEEPLPYVTIALFDAQNGNVLQAGTSNEQGKFELQTSSDNFYIEITFIGFESQQIKNFNLQQSTIDLGIIKLMANKVALKEVNINGEKSTVEFKLDKRVFNVGKDISSTGMSAMEVLNRVPSVTVDIEGQIKLRGNAGVQILINGKPSVLSDEGSKALGTITAEMIESVEVITNPSAKYEAGGTSGILNIVLKKEERKGFNGSVSLNTGIPANHSAGISLNRRTEKLNFFTQFGGGYRSLPNYNKSVNYNVLDGITMQSKGTEYRNEYFGNMLLGSDYFINPLNTFTLSGSVAYEAEQQPSQTNFDILNNNNVLESSYTRTENTTAGNPKYQYDAQYKKQFKNNEDHVLLLSSQGSLFAKDQESDFVNESSNFNNIAPNQQTKTNFYQQDFSYKADYTNPFSEAHTLELGGLYDMNNVGNDFEVYNQDSTQTWILDSNLTNDFQFVQNVLGIYATGAYEKNRWGIKLGLRMENTVMSTLLKTTDEENNRRYTNWFPTLHASFTISEHTSMQLGYSRRIFRPRLWDLNPFFNIRNNFNIRRGNPNLQPEFADSYELTAIFVHDKLSLNASLYHLYTQDVIERVSYFENNVNIVSPINIGTRNQTGLELNAKLSVHPKITLNGDFNYGYFTRKGSFEQQNFDFSNDQWTSRVGSNIKLPAQFELELNGDYQSSLQTVQGTISGFAFANVGLRKKFWKGKVVGSMGINDIFASRIRESRVMQTRFEMYDFSKRGRFLTLNLSYSIGKGEAMSYNGRFR